MKSKLLSAICMPAALAVGAATAMAQDANPPAAPSPAPVERAPDAATPSPAPAPTPAPTAAPTDPAPSPSAEAPSSDTTKSASNFSSTQSGDEWRSSKLIGMAVYNRANERVGDINDLILGPDGKVASAVIGVGGFLGIGEKLVAVDFSELQLNRDADGSMRATINSTKESLESAPDYKFAK
jgi:sporulation protein YlmC with PRC-barrel domain